MSGILFNLSDTSVTPSWTTKKPSGFRKCLHSLRPFSKPITWIVPSAHIMSNVSSGKLIVNKEQFLVKTRFERLSSWIRLFSLFSRFWSMSIPIIFPLLNFANSMVGIPEPQPTSRIWGLFILGRILKACLVYLRKYSLILSFSVSNSDSIDVFNYSGCVYTK